MSDLPAQFFHGEDSFCSSALSRGRHTPKTAPGRERHSVRPARLQALQRENVEHNVLPASPKEETFSELRND